MNKFLLALTVVFSAGYALPSRAEDPSNGTLVLVRAVNVFIPNGFDDNDEVQVVLDGYLPNSCHRLAYTNVQKDAESGKITVTQWARRFPTVCLPTPVPFTTEANLGQLPAKDYVVEVYGSPDESMTIKHANGFGPDDFLYAPADTARVEKAADGSLIGIVQGRISNTCMRKVEIIVHDSGRTIEVLPTIAMDEHGTCEASEATFTWTFALPPNLSEGRHLLHVRSLNGKGINVVFSIPLSLAPH